MKKLIYIACGLLPIFSWGQVDRTIVPSAAPAPTININDSEVFKTTNGITVILSENHKIPKVSFQLTLGSDPIPEGPKAGMSEIMGEMILSGTKSMNKDKLDNETDYIGARLTAGADFMSLSVMTKYMDKGLALMSDVLQNASFPDAEFDRIVKQMESNLKAAKSEGGRMAAHANAKVNYDPSHPFNEVMTEESLKNIKLDDIKMLYKFTYVPEGSYLVIVGDITRADAEKAVNTYFSSWTGGRVYKGQPLNTKPANGSNVVFVNKPGAVQSVINVNLPMNIEPGDPDQIGLSVLHQVFGGNGFGTRLMQNLREDHAYTYGCYARPTIDEHGSLVTISGNFRNAVTDSAITEIIAEIAQITSELATDDEIETTKAAMAGSFARSLENPQTVARFALNIEKYGLDKNYYKNYLKTLAAVDKNEMLRLAKKYMSAENLNIVVVGNEEVLPKLTRFDKDGKITKLDAFGNAIKEKKAADISADQLIQNYILAVTKTSSLKKAQKKLKKIKTMERKVEFTSDRIPFPLVMTEVWMSPNMEGNKMEGNKMVMQSSYFNGKTGAVTVQGTKTDFSAIEIAAKLKSEGILPELNYKKTGMTYSIKDIEVIDGKDMYVLYTNDGESERYDFFDKVTFMKMRTLIVQTRDGESSTTELMFDGYSDQAGMMWPSVMNMVSGPMNLAGKIVSQKFNEKLTLDAFQ